MACEVTLTLNRIVSCVIHRRPFSPRWNFAHEKPRWVSLGEHSLHWLFIYRTANPTLVAFLFEYMANVCSEEKVLLCPVSLFQTKGFVLLLYSIQLQHFKDYGTLWGVGLGGGGWSASGKKKQKKEVQGNGQSKLVSSAVWRAVLEWMHSMPWGSAGIVLCVHSDEVVVEFKDYFFLSVFSPAFLEILINHCSLAKLTALYKRPTTKTTLTYISNKL